MFKELIVALICVVTFNAAARVPHGEPTKKQVTYPGYNNVAAFYQDPSQFYNAAYPQSQAGVVGQGQTLSSSAAGTTGASVKQSIVPQKSAAYPVSNSVSSQYTYPFKQYYPQIYPQNSQYPPVPSVFYVPSQGRFPSTANEGVVSNEGTSVSSGNQGSGSGSWFNGGGWNQLPNWQSPQLPQLPQGAGSYPSFPSLPNYPANLPQFPSQFPTQFPSQFPSQFPTQLPQFPSNFPSGNFPSFPGSSPANAVPTGTPGSEAVAGATTNSEGHSVVVVSARKPEKIENVDSNAEGVKNEVVDKAVADFPPQQYYFLQPQYLFPNHNAGQLPVVQTASGKDPVQLDGAAKGAVSSFLFQPQQPAVAQPTSGQQYSQISQNKLYSPQEFQELLQQVQVANKKLIESSGGSAAPQFYYQQGVPQQGFVQQSVSSPAQSQDVASQQVQGVIPQQYIIQGAQPSVAQIQQPYLQFAGPHRQIFLPQQFASLPQPKPVVGEVSNVPGVQGVEGTVPVSGAGPASVSIPSVSSSPPANDSTSSPEPNNNADSESTGSSADADRKDEVNEIPFNDAANTYQSTTPTPVETQNAVLSSESPIPETKPDNEETNDDESTIAENTIKQNNLEFGARLNIVKPKAQKL